MKNSTPDTRLKQVFMGAFSTGLFSVTCCSNRINDQLHTSGINKTPDAAGGLEFLPGSHCGRSKDSERQKDRQSAQHYIIPGDDAPIHAVSHAMSSYKRFFRSRAAHAQVSGDNSPSVTITSAKQRVLPMTCASTSSLPVDHWIASSRIAAPAAVEPTAGFACHRPHPRTSSRQAVRVLRSSRLGIKQVIAFGNYQFNIGRYDTFRRYGLLDLAVEHGVVDNRVRFALIRFRSMV